jgi:hypothetical protein
VEREGRKQYLGLRDAAYVKYARKSVGYEPIILSSVVFRRSDSATRARTDRIRFPMAVANPRDRDVRSVLRNSKRRRIGR